MGRFSKPYSEYTRELSPVEQYRERMIDGLVRSTGCTLEAATNIVEDAIIESGYEALNCTYTQKQPDETRAVVTKPMVQYLKGVEVSDFVMAPTLTTFYPRRLRKSLITGEIVAGMTKRKGVKRQAQLDKLAGNITAATIGKGLQNAIKVFINSWSGATQSAFNPFYCKSTHPVLTSMCRISTAIATAMVERALAGKRYYFEPHKVTEDLMLTIAKCPREQIKAAQMEYDLHVPTVDELLDIVRASYKYYWWDESKEETFLPLMNSLDDVERMAFAYSGDFYHLFKYNHKLISKFLNNVTNINPDTLPTAIIKEINGSAGDISKAIGKDERDLLANLVGSEIAGVVLEAAIDPESNKYRGEEFSNLVYRIASNITLYMDSFAPMISAFFRTDILPIDLGKQDNAIRKTVPLGDTDSTVYTTKHINKLHYGCNSFGTEQEPVANFCIYLINGMIEHGLGSFTGQLGVEDEFRTKLIMKNEFGFPSLMLTNVAKHYMGYKKTEEGLVYDKLEFERKGVRLHAGKLNDDAREQLHAWAERTMVELNSNKLIDRGELVDMILDIEGDIEASLTRTEGAYYNRVRMKPLAEYSRPQSQEYGKHVFWNKVFGEKYGFAPENEPYMAYKCSLKFNGRVSTWVETLTPEQQRGYKEYLAYIEKDDKHVPTFITIPMDVYKLKSTPTELLDLVDREKVAKTSTDAHLLHLSSLGIILDYSKQQLKLSDYFTDNM